MAFRVAMPLGSLLVISLLASCAPAEREKVVQIPENTWGLEFKHTPISEASDSEKQWGKAVALVRTATGMTATGFFISSDGLFLSNEHVFPRLECNAERCAGYQIIREFAPNGDFEIYTRFKVLAQNPDLDFALLKVELPAGEKVPHLDLAEPQAGKAVSLEDRSLRILGHPFGASLQSSQAVFLYNNDSKLELRSVAISGNSGSPLIDVQNGWVVGLYHASDWSKGSIRKDNGAVQHVGEAIDVFAIRKLLAKIFPDTRGKAILTASDFNTARNDYALKKVLPRSQADALADAEPTVSAFVAQALDTSAESVVWNRMIATEVRSVSGTQQLTDVLDTMVLTDQYRGTKLRLTLEQANTFSNALSDSDNALVRAELGVFLGTYSPSTCVSLVGSQTHFHGMSLYAGVCQSSIGHNGGVILDQLLKDYDDADLVSHLSEYQLRLTNAILSSLAQQGAIPSYQSLRVLAVLEKVAAQTVQLTTACHADELHTLIQRDLSLVGPGAFRTSF